MPATVQILPTNASSWSAAGTARPKRLEVKPLHLGVERSDCATPARPGLPARALLGGVWVYQRTLSPLLPALFGSAACGCRFYPTCSHYAAGAVRTHGAMAGTWLTARRLLKCTPLHPGGNDPVPPRRGAAPALDLGG